MTSTPGVLAHNASASLAPDFKALIQDLEGYNSQSTSAIYQSLAQRIPDAVTKVEAILGDNWNIPIGDWRRGLVAQLRTVERLANRIPIPPEAAPLISRDLEFRLERLSRQARYGKIVVRHYSGAELEFTPNGNFGRFLRSTDPSGTIDPIVRDWTLVDSQLAAQLRGVAVELGLGGKITEIPFDTLRNDYDKLFWGLVDSQAPRGLDNWRNNRRVPGIEILPEVREHFGLRSYIEYAGPYPNRIKNTGIEVHNLLPGNPEQTRKALVDFAQTVTDQEVVPGQVHMVGHIPWEVYRTSFGSFVRVEFDRELAFYDMFERRAHGEPLRTKLQESTPPDQGTQAMRLGDHQKADFLVEQLDYYHRLATGQPSSMHPNQRKLEGYARHRGTKYDGRGDGYEGIQVRSTTVPPEWIHRHVVTGETMAEDLWPWYEAHFYQDAKEVFGPRDAVRMLPQHEIVELQIQKEWIRRLHFNQKVEEVFPPSSEDSSPFIASGLKPHLTPEVTSVLRKLSKNDYIYLALVWDYTEDPVFYRRPEILKAIQEAQRIIVRRLAEIIRKGVPTLSDFVRVDDPHEFARHEQEVIEFAKLMAEQYRKSLGIPSDPNALVTQSSWKPLHIPETLFEKWHAVYGDALFQTK